MSAQSERPPRWSKKAFRLRKEASERKSKARGDEAPAPAPAPAAPRKLMREQVEAAISSVLGPAWIETRSQITDKIMKLLEVEPAPPEVGK